MSTKITASDRHIARDISYASSAETRSGRLLIRAMENASGRLGLIKRAAGYERDVAEGRDFWEVMAERYGLSLDVVAGSFENLPKSGPLILVANHPYGVLDGLMMGLILSKLRGDFRILAHRVFKKSEDLDRIILPVSFDQTKEAVALNLQTRKDSLAFLDAGGAIGIFPGGTVSTPRTPMGTPLDPAWRSFTAKMIAKSNAQVVPIYFEGANSRLFHLASHLHVTLRMGLLIREFGARVDRPVRLAIGKPIAPEALAAHKGDSKEMMGFLRDQTYALATEPLKDQGLGYEFEEKHGATKHMALKERY